MEGTGSPISRELEEACRDALVRYRLEAFDNIDANGLLRGAPFDAGRAEWLGRHLLSHARTSEAYERGQHILKLLNPFDVT